MLYMQLYYIGTTKDKIPAEETGDTNTIDKHDGNLGTLRNSTSYV